MRGASLSRLIDLAAQLARDADREPDVLRRRDRALHRELGGAAQQGVSGIAAWLDRMRPAGVESPGERAERTARALVAGLLVAGALVGVGAAAALFTYDGRHPVNVVRVLAVFVGLQLALLTTTLVLCLPQSWRRRVPGLAALQDLLALVSPGRLAAGLRRLLPGPQREEAARLLGLARRHQRLYGDVQRWWLLSASQGFGVAFNLAAIATALGLVAFTDLAFGWSTTLDVDARTLLHVTRWLSLPWSLVWEAAVPTAELIERTQYFRAVAHHDPGAGAPWWRFLLACMVCYGLLPRAAMLGFARWRLSAALARAFRRVPGVAALRDRLESRLVETAAAEAEAGGRAGSAPARVAAPPAPGTRCHALVWAGFPLADAEAASRALGVEVVSLELAGSASLGQDAAALRALAATPSDEPVLVITRAWEPPMLELLDFLAELRGALGEGRGVLVVPLGLDAESAPTAPAKGDADTWRRAVDRLGDPATSLSMAAAS